MSLTGRRVRGHYDAGDLVSNLPDDLKSHIISVMPHKMAIRTCILSKKWKFVWALRRPTLSIVIPHGVSLVTAWKFEEFVDEALTYRSNCGFDIERLCFSSEGSFWFGRILSWLDTAAKLNVQELELTFIPERPLADCFQNLFASCNTLSALTLSEPIILDLTVVGGDALPFPFLKKLNLVYIRYSGENAFENLISSCPILEYLYVGRRLRGDSDNNVKTMQVTSPSLKTLRIDFRHFLNPRCKLVVQAPNLQHIHLMDKMSKDIFVKKSSSFVEAFVDVWVGSIIRILKGISSVKKLTLKTDPLEVVHTKLNNRYGPINMPVFDRLTTLVVYECSGDVLNALLSCMPVVEDITFKAGLCHKLHEWVPLKQVARCLLITMKVVKIQKGIEARELPLLGYLLQHAKNMESLTISNGKEVSGEQVLSLPRGSAKCQIGFI